jgi:hypothetical protein
MYQPHWSCVPLPSHRPFSLELIWLGVPNCCVYSLILLLSYCYSLPRGIAQGVPCITTVTDPLCFSPHLSPNHSWYTHHSSLAVTSRHLVAKQERLGEKCPWMLPISISFMLYGSLTCLTTICRRLYICSESSATNVFKLHRPLPGLNLRTLGTVSSSIMTRPQRTTRLS